MGRSQCYVFGRRGKAVKITRKRELHSHYVQETTPNHALKKFRKNIASKS